MPILDWIGKKQVINHDKELPFRLLKRVDSLSVGTNENLIIKGDNLEALKALMPYYYNKVKCIYIDPPYNTGSENWAYNDKVNSPEIQKWLGKVVNKDDLTRHDKWLCMMMPRLKLLWELLCDDGAIFISIDDHEVEYLKMLMNDVFGEQNFVSQIVWKKKTGSGTKIDKVFDEHEYILTYAKNELIKQKWRVLSSEEGNYKNPDNDDRGPWESCAITAPSKNRNPNQLYQIEILYNGISKKVKAIDEGKKKIDEFNYGNHKIIFREIDSQSHNLAEYDKKKKHARFIRRWAYIPKTMKGVFKEKKVFFKNGNLPRYKKFETVHEGKALRSIYFNDFSTQEGSNEINQILGDDIFEYPKPKNLIKHLIGASLGKNDIVLDSFAGTGTTAHAVLDLNNEDGGDRKFILVEMEKDIAKKITAERIKRVIKGYSYENNKGTEIKVKGLGGGFQFMNLDNELFDAHGLINYDVTFTDLARYIFFTETKLDLKEKLIKGYFIGNNNGTEYYLVYKKGKDNVLNEKNIKKLKKTAKYKIVYADNCTLATSTLKNLNVTFKQIPYEVRGF